MYSTIQLTTGAPQQFLHYSFRSVETGSEESIQFYILCFSIDDPHLDKMRPQVKHKCKLKRQCCTCGDYTVSNADAVIFTVTTAKCSAPAVLNHYD